MKPFSRILISFGSWNNELKGWCGWLVWSSNHPLKKSLVLELNIRLGYFIPVEWYFLFAELRLEAEQAMITDQYLIIDSATNMEDCNNFISSNIHLCHMCSLTNEIMVCAIFILIIILPITHRWLGQISNQYFDVINLIW